MCGGVRSENLQVKTCSVCRVATFPSVFCSATQHGNHPGSSWEQEHCTRSELPSVCQVCCPKLLAPNSSLHFLRRAAAPDAVALVALGTISSRLTHARDARKRVWRVSITVFYFRKKIGAHRFRSGGHERITSSSAEAACGNGGATVGSRRAARGRKGIRSSHTRIGARTQAQRRGVTL